jgi:CheY-like chemotaxis protein
MGCADMLRLRLSHDRALYELADIIVKTARHSSQLTRQLLDFARKGSYESIPLNIHKIVGEVISILEHSIDKRIVIQKHFNAQSAIINGDPMQLQNIFLNLAINARDAMPLGGELCIATKNRTLDEKFCRRIPFEIAPGEYVEISVKDTGVGMDAATQKRIFEPFFTTKEKGKGTGMGLAAVYGAVKSLHGAITVKSKPGCGTDFAVFFPIALNEEKSRENEFPQKPAKATLKILIIDDEEVVCDVVSKMIQKSGHTVTAFTSGLEALKLYERSSNEIDIVILDLVMPQISALDVFERLRKINPRVKVLLASGYSAGDEAQAILQLGAAGFIQKPFSVVELEHKLEEIAKRN